MATTLLQFRIVRHGVPYPELLTTYYGPALVHAIAQTIEGIQEYTRAQMPNRFTIRTASSRRLLRNLVSIDRDEFPSNRLGRYRGRVGIKASLNASESIRRFAPRIARFTTGGEETMRDTPLYVPTRTLRPTPGAPIRRTLYPKALGVLESRTIEGGETAGFHRTKRGRILIRGSRRTYAVDPRFHPNAPHGTHGVWQRRGRGRNSEIFLLWTYQRRIKIPRRIPWREDSERIYRQTFIPRLTAYLERRAIRSLVRSRL